MRFIILLHTGYPLKICPYAYACDIPTGSSINYNVPRLARNVLLAFHSFGLLTRARNVLVLSSPSAFCSIIQYSIGLICQTVYGYTRVLSCMLSPTELSRLNSRIYIRCGFLFAFFIPNRDSAIYTRLNENLIGVLLVQE